MPLNERLFIMYLSGCLYVPPPEGLYRCWVYISFKRIMYVNAGLKGRGNRGRIMLLGRGPRCRGLRVGRWRGGWDKDVIPVFTIIGRNGHEVYIPSRDVRGETVARIASRHVEAGSKIYTDSFPS
jgi:hypothetical protein